MTLRFFLAILLSISGWQIFAAEPDRNLGINVTGEKRVALVIGNGKYPAYPLKNPANDARDMATALRKIGFDVIEKTDITQKEMNRAIAQFGGKLTTDTVALFFYAGHGIQVRGKNYLIPIDAQIESENSVRAETVDVDTLLDQLAASPLNVVILDACRNNPFERRFRTVGGGLAQMDAPKGTLIAYSTSPGKVASDGEGRNGLYTQELLKIIQTPGLPVEQAFKKVRANVARATRDNQIPWEASSLTGDFFFSPLLGSTPSVPQQVVPLAAPGNGNAISPELEFWEAIKDSRNPIELKAYLDTYPGGQFQQLALARIKSIEKEPTKVTPPNAPPSTPARMAKLHIVRPVQFTGPFNRPDVFLNGSIHGELSNGSYLVADVAAEQHTVTIKYGSGVVIIDKVIDLTLGGVFYFEFAINAHGPSTLIAMTKSAGDAAVAAATRGRAAAVDSASVSNQQPLQPRLPE